MHDTISISHSHIVCLQESKLNAIDSMKCRAFLPSYLSAFTFSPVDGTCVGLVMAWNPDVVSAGDISSTDHCLSISFSSTSSNHTFTITNVYAPTDHRDLPSFMSEFESVPPPQTINWVGIGDFNLTRSPTDKNTPNFNSSLANRFNRLIDGLSLLEFPLLDRLYTWSNKRDSPTLARLDRAFFNNAFGSTFPNASLSSWLGSTSDHIPPILTIPTTIPKTHHFLFENAWLKHPSFLPSTTPA